MISVSFKTLLFTIRLAAILFCLQLPISANTPEHSADVKDAYPYLNRLRKQAGLSVFIRNDRLEASAQDHARYLSRNSPVGHKQKPGNRGFTGEAPGDRAAFRGYPSRAVTENFSAGQATARKSIDNLMSAIYHRFAFLDVSKNQLGVGRAGSERGMFFVYNMGNDRLARFCQYTVYTGDGPFYTDTCYHSDKVSATEFELRRGETGRENPEMILWPPDGSEGVPTAFYEEVPDPLPDYRVSGYPVSVQLNPFRIKKAKLKTFRLYVQRTEREVTPVRVMTRQLDPNQRFGDLDFALFPLNRLDPDTLYRAEVSLAAESKEIRRIWFFRTAAPPDPMFIIAGRGEILKLQSDRSYLVHVPAVRQLPYIEELHWEAMSGMAAEVVWQDRNTLRIRLSGSHCKSARFEFNGGRSFTVQVSAADNLNQKQRYPRGTLPRCVIDTIKDLPGFRIAAGGEVIPMSAGVDYWVEIDNTGEPVTEIKWQLMSGMAARVDQLNGNLLKIHVTGKPGQIATFFLSQSRIFKVVLTR